MFRRSGDGEIRTRSGIIRACLVDSYELSLPRSGCAYLRACKALGSHPAPSGKVRGKGFEKVHLMREQQTTTEYRGTKCKSHKLEYCSMLKARGRIRIGYSSKEDIKRMEAWYYSRQRDGRLAEDSEDMGGADVSFIVCWKDVEAVYENVGSVRSVCILDKQVEEVVERFRAKARMLSRSRSHSTTVTSPSLAAGRPAAVIPSFHALCLQMLRVLQYELVGWWSCCYIQAMLHETM